MKRENGRVFQELTEERKKSVGLGTRVEQLEILVKQNEEKKRGLTNEKELIFKQYQYEVQRCRNLEGNEMKLRSSFETIQQELNSKINQYN